MKKFIKLSLKACIIVVLGIGLFKSYTLCKKSTLNKDPFSLKTKQIEKPFIVLVLAQNPGKNCEKNITSIFSQEYQNYKILYLDDNSTDDSLELVKKTASRLQQEDKITIKPETNLWQAVQECQDQDIILILDAKDFLAHEQVLTKLNRLYSNPFIWMTYGSFLDYPSYKHLSLQCKEIPKSVIVNNSYRSYDIENLHPISFTASLFKQINSQDLENHSNSYLFPLFEMAGKHARFVPDILSLHIKSSEIGKKSSEKKQPKYQKLKSLPLLESEKP